VRPDVAEACGAEQGITESVGEHIAIGVAKRAFVKWKRDAADDKRTALSKAV
jgi:hypothetical protein